MSSASPGDDAAALNASTHRRPRANTRRAQTDASPPDEARPVIAAFLRALADRVEQDPAFGRALLAVYAQSCAALPRGAADMPAAGKGQKRSQTARTQATSSAAAQITPPAAANPPLSPPRDPALDPFALLRAHGEAALRARLGGLDQASLRGVVRAHRLDPARISARWSTRERLIDLIVEQVCARANLGRAFEHV